MYACQRQNALGANTGPAATSTFAYQFPIISSWKEDVETVLITEVGDVLDDGVLNMMGHIGIIPEDKLPFPWMSIETPLVTKDEDFVSGLWNLLDCFCQRQRSAQRSTKMMLSEL